MKRTISAQTGSTRASSERPQVRKAVIPAAGLGTRLFPATKATKKEWFPIVDRDGIAKPAILLIVEEALEAGIEEIVIVVQPEDVAGFAALFNEQPPAEVYDKLSRPLQAYADRMLEMGRRVSFATQPVQEGFGHAVYRAREVVGDEPFLLMLGDHLYRAPGTTSCARQMVEAYQQHGTSVLGLRRTPEHEISNYGTATGTWLEEGRLLALTELTEKPTVDYAQTSLRVPGLPAQEYLTFFGLYVIKHQVFEYLEEHVASDTRERGEFQLTSALDRLRAQDGILGLIVEGRCYDIGLPDSYVDTLVHLRQA
jgi:UTP--glucose-1-phosphate uridylyltransferase